MRNLKSQQQLHLNSHVKCKRLFLMHTLWANYHHISLKYIFLKLIFLSLTRTQTVSQFSKYLWTVYQMFCNEDYSVGNSYLIEVSDKVILQGVCCCWLLAASMNSSTELQLCCSVEEGLFSVLSSFITFDKLVSVPEFWLHFIVVSICFFAICHLNS